MGTPTLSLRIARALIFRPIWPPLTTSRSGARSRSIRWQSPESSRHKDRHHGTEGHSSLPPGLRSGAAPKRSEEHTSELQSLMRISYAVFFLKKKKYKNYSNQ